jgi:hypothetical protein
MVRAHIQQDAAAGNRQQAARGAQRHASRTVQGNTDAQHDGGQILRKPAEGLHQYGGQEPG